MPRSKYRDTILDCLSRESPLTVGELKWQVAERIVDLPEPESYLPIGRYQLPARFIVSFSRCLSSLRGREIHETRTKSMPSEERLPVVHASQSKNLIVKRAREEILLLLITENPRLDLRGSRSQRIREGSISGYEKYLSSRIDKPSAYRSQEDRDAVPRLQSMSAMILSFLFQMNLADFNPSFQPGRDMRSMFITSLGKFHEWATLRRCRPEKGLYLAAQSILGLLAETPERDRYEDLRRELEALCELLESLATSAAQTIRVKARIQSWSTSSGRTCFNLSEDVIAYLAGTHNEECIRYSKYTTPIDDSCATSRKRSGGFVWHAYKPVLPSDHVFHQLITQDVFRSVKLLHTDRILEST